MMGCCPQSSCAVAKPVLVGSVDWLQARFRISGGQVMAGALVSQKVMCWTQLVKLPQPSVAFQLRSIPCLPVQLVGVSVSVKVITTGEGQLSVAVAVPV